MAKMIRLHVKYEFNTLNVICPANKVTVSLLSIQHVSDEEEHT